MNKQELQTRVDELKKQNSEDNTKLTNLNIMRQTIVQECWVRNGRILELEEILSKLDGGGGTETCQ